MIYLVSKPSKTYSSMGLSLSFDFITYLLCGLFLIYKFCFFNPLFLQVEISLAYVCGNMNMSLSCRMVSMVLYFYYIPIIIYILYYLVFKILSSFVRDSSYHDMYYKGCGLLCAHKKSFNTAIPVRSLGPYMYVHYCTCIVHILVWTYHFIF